MYHPINLHEFPLKYENQLLEATFRSEIEDYYYQQLFFKDNREINTQVLIYVLKSLLVYELRIDLFYRMMDLQIRIQVNLSQKSSLQRTYNQLQFNSAGERNVPYNSFKRVNKTIRNCKINSND